jgi:hypothetical protein
MDKEALEAGVRTMLQIAAKLIAKEKNIDEGRLLKNRPDDDEHN